MSKDRRLVNGNSETLTLKIAESWDRNVEVRVKDLRDSTDYSYINIIEPWVVNTVCSITEENDRILDIGCGCGYLTNAIYEKERKIITGIDISRQSISIAKSMYPRINFLTQNIYNYEPSLCFSLCVSVMVMNNLFDIEEFCKSLFKILDDNGKAVIVIPHPCFWPLKHINDNSYSYLEDGEYLFRFSTKGQREYPADVIYFHRSLEKYYNCFRNNGFLIESIIELPEMKKSEKPDILGLIIKKCKSENVHI